MDEKERAVAEQRRLRSIALASVAVSVAAVLGATVTLPLLYSYVQAVQSDVATETDYCKVRSRDMWLEMWQLDQQQHGSSVRQKRGWLFGQWVPDGGVGGGAGGEQYEAPGNQPTYNAPAPANNGYGPVVNAEPSCCTCQQGPVGPAGPPGEDGQPGADGAPGADGKAGKDGGVLPHDGKVNEPCIICPPGPQGPQGAPGAKGPNGPRGTPGLSGQDGRRGEPGMHGPAGPAGAPGTEGVQGKRGENGKVIQIQGPPGPSGQPGAKGPKGLKGHKGTSGGTAPGPKGAPGDPGRKGRSGRKGDRGPVGPLGSRGREGDCFHCPTPRTPPGY